MGVMGNIYLINAIIMFACCIKSITSGDGITSIVCISAVSGWFLAFLESKKD